MYETLLHEAEEERIDVVYRPLRGKTKGLYCNGVIAINRNISSTTEKACILAEELGHYHTSVGNILDQSKLQNRKQELQARAWSYQKLVPLDKLVEAYKAGIKTRHELADFLEVTEVFLMAALQKYKEKYGIYCRIGNYYLCFEPLGIIENFEIRHQEQKPAKEEAGFVLK